MQPQHSRGPGGRRPRIAILGSRGIPARYGGFETFAEQISVRLAARGIDVTVFGESDNSPGLPSSYQGVAVRYVRRRSLGALSTVLFDAQCLWQARRSFDVVYMLGYGAAPFCMLPRAWGTEVWINMDGLEWKRSKWSAPGRAYLRLMEWVAIRVAHVVVADADSIRENLEGRHGRLRDCRVLAYGTELPDLQQLRGNDAVPGVQVGGYYLVVCRIEPENHVLELVQGFLQSGSSRRLVVVGDVSGSSSYVRRLHEIAESRVLMLGTVYDQKRLQAIRAGAVAYLHGHSVGGTNPSLLEALAVGNVVIAHDNPFNREVTDGNALFFSNSADVARCINAVEEMTSDCRAELARRSRERARVHYSWDHITDQYIQALQTARVGR